MTTLRWLILCLLILIAALLLRVGFFAYVAYTLAGVLIVSHLMGRFSLDRIELERHCNRVHARVGDDATVTAQETGGRTRRAARRGASLS